MLFLKFHFAEATSMYQKIILFIMQDNITQDYSPESQQKKKKQFYSSQLEYL